MYLSLSHLPVSVYPTLPHLPVSVYPSLSHLPVSVYLLLPHLLVSVSPSFVDLVWALVVLVQAPADLVQIFVDLVQAHLSQGVLISVISRQVVVRPGLGLIGSVWSVLVRWVRRKQVYNAQVVSGLGVRLVVSGLKG